MNIRIKQKPIIINDEKNGYYSINTDYGVKITNEEGKKIIELINEGVAFKSITDQLLSSSSQTDHLEWIKSFIYSLELVGLITIDDDSSMDLNEKNTDTFYVAGESDYAKLSSQIIKDLDSTFLKYAISYDPKYYNPYFIRTRSFSNRENYFFQIKKNYGTLIGIRNINENKVPVIIVLIRYDDIKAFLDLYKKVEKELISLDQYKIKIHIPNSHLTNELIELLDRLHYSLEAVLAKEDGVNDYSIFCKFLKP